MSRHHHSSLPVMAASEHRFSVDESRALGTDVGHALLNEGTLIEHKGQRLWVPAHPTEPHARVYWRDPTLPTFLREHILLKEAALPPHLWHKAEEAAEGVLRSRSAVYRPEARWRGFRNGVFDLETGSFLPWHLADTEDAMGVAHAATWHNVEVPLAAHAPHLIANATPVLDAFLEAAVGAEGAEWARIVLGRLLFAYHERDAWGLVPAALGLGTGPTLFATLARELVGPDLVASLAGVGNLRPLESQDLLGWHCPVERLSLCPDDIATLALGTNPAIECPGLFWGNGAGDGASRLLRSRIRDKVLILPFLPSVAVLEPSREQLLAELPSILTRVVGDYKAASRFASGEAVRAALPPAWKASLPSKRERIAVPLPTRSPVPLVTEHAKTEGIGDWCVAEMGSGCGRGSGSGSGT